MRSFDDLVGKALEKAEGRTRASTEQIQSTIAQVVDAASSRFADATDELRKVAGSIRGELEQTRAEIKRGVLELPEETKQSTSAMRRAVGEQINALKELADIVAKSGRTFDVSDRKPAERPLSQAAAPRSAPVQPAPAPAAPAAPLAAGVATAPRTAFTAPSAPAEPRISAPAASAPPAAQQVPSGGWVRDLLRGASREEAAPAPVARASQPERSPLHLVESLNSLSVDIARAIDHEASVELWDRYRRGERNIFTRRLYTLKGQQTFDEIRRKYQTDGEFRGAVDRYCRDFEKLLDDVARNDRDNMMTQTYLTSDTGKVYTMLAHASGRLK
jgi:hypothetical protein